MDPEKLHLICNGIASIADATTSTFDDVVDALEIGAVLTIGEAREVQKYLESL